MKAEIDVQCRLGDFQLDVCVQVDAGPVVLIGPNGAGKTTVLRLLAGACRPDDGRIVVGGKVLVDTQKGVFLAPQERGVGYLPQHGQLFPHLTALDNVAYGMTGARAKQQEMAQALLTQMGAGDLSHRRPHQLSGGQAQRVAIARALSRPSSLLLFDEPTAALDVQARRHIRTVLSNVFVQPDRFAVVVSHDVRDLLAWDPHVVFVDAGRVCCEGRLVTLKAVKHPFLQELLGVDTSCLGQIPAEISNTDHDTHV